MTIFPSFKIELSHQQNEKKKSQEIILFKLEASYLLSWEAGIKMVGRHQRKSTAASGFSSVTPLIKSFSAQVSENLEASKGISHQPLLPASGGF